MRPSQALRSLIGVGASKVSIHNACDLRLFVWQPIYVPPPPLTPLLLWLLYCQYSWLGYLNPRWPWVVSLRHLEPKGFMQGNCWPWFIPQINWSGSRLQSRYQTLPWTPRPVSNVMAVLWLPCFLNPDTLTSPSARNSPQTRATWSTPIIISVRFLYPMDPARLPTLSPALLLMDENQTSLLLITQVKGTNKGILGITLIRHHGNLIDWDKQVLVEPRIETADAVFS